MTLNTEIPEDLSFDKTIEYAKTKMCSQASIEFWEATFAAPYSVNHGLSCSFCHVMGLLDCSNTGEHVLNHICLVHGHAINPFDLTFDQPRALFIQADKGSLTELFHLLDMLS